MKKKIHNLLFISTLFFTVNSWASLVYTPVNLKPDSARLVVVIHGCLQSAESMALGTGWNQWADKKNWVILYPQVPEGSHPIGCWGWFLPENQKAESGQLKILIDEIRHVKSSLKMKKAPVYLAGISSGGATVAGLLACFPREIAAGAIHSSPSYGLAQNQSEAEKVMKEGPGEEAAKGSCQSRDFTGSILVIQGALDVVVNPKNADRLISDFVPVVTSKDIRQTDATYITTDYFANGILRGRLIRVQGLGHAWAGYAENLRYGRLVGPQGQFPTMIPFFSASGPSATNLMAQFFESLPPDLK